MIKVDKIEVFNWEGAIRGMRNPLNSWDKSDSHDNYEYDCYPWVTEPFIIGENDLALMRKLCRAGSDHRKFLRQIMVSMDITAPRYWWPEFDTYKVGTVANSTSTMHTIHKRPFVLDDFSCDCLKSTETLFDVTYPIGEMASGHADEDLTFTTETDCVSLTSDIIKALNVLRDKFNETGDKTYWRAMIQLLPQSYNQLRTVTLNYEVLLNMYHARKAHKLSEWRELCSVIETLPYFADICLTEEKEKC